MSILLRFFLFYCLILVAGILWMGNVFYQDITPSLRQASEDVMADTANLMAEFLAPAFSGDSIDINTIDSTIRKYQARKIDAVIWSHKKQSTNLEFYLTDATGRLIYHTIHPEEIGKDYSGWRDVALTLKGEYGARTTRLDPDNELTSEMYIAAPIIVNNALSGVVTVIQPSKSIQPFIHIAQRKVLWAGFVLVFALLGIALFLAFAVKSIVNSLLDYIDSVRRGKNVGRLSFSDKTFDKLARSMHSMRVELDGKAYIEQYIHTLTHELKTPLASISGSAQILEKELTRENRSRFVQNIESEVARMKKLVERVLLLAEVENLEITDLEAVDICKIINEEIDSLESVFGKKRISVKLINVCEHGQGIVQGDEFLLRLAIRNILDNAIDFSKEGEVLTICISDYKKQLRLEVMNKGPLIPDYALPRLFERFYSTERDHNGKKSSGLGLCLVREIMDLHQGNIVLQNIDQGVKSTLIFNQVIS